MKGLKQKDLDLLAIYRADSDTHPDGYFSLPAPHETPWREPRAETLRRRARLILAGCLASAPEDSPNRHAAARPEDLHRITDAGRAALKEVV